MENSTFMNPRTNLYETYWWLAPKYFKQLASRPTYLIAIESGIMLHYNRHSICWKLSNLFCSAAKSKTPYCYKLIDSCISSHWFAIGLPYADCSDNSSDERKMDRWCQPSWCSKLSLFVARCHVSCSNRLIDAYYGFNGLKSLHLRSASKTVQQDLQQEINSFHGGSRRDNHT